MLYTADLKNEKNNADKCVWYASICVKKEKKHLLVIHKTFLYDLTRNWIAIGKGNSVPGEEKRKVFHD